MIDEDQGVVSKHRTSNVKHPTSNGKKGWRGEGLAAKSQELKAGNRLIVYRLSS